MREDYVRGANQPEDGIYGLAVPPQPVDMTEPVPDPKEEYRPSNQEALKEYEIRLQFLNRGCIVHVGCKSIDFETIESAM